MSQLLVNALTAIVLLFCIWRLTHSKGKLMQAKFVITFTEAAAVQPIQLTTTAFSGIVGTPESGNVGPTGGSGGPYTVTVDPTTPLPVGVTLDTSGNVGGTPTAAGVTSVNIAVADSQG